MAANFPISCFLISAVNQVNNLFDKAGCRNLLYKNTDYSDTGD